MPKIIAYITLFFLAHAGYAQNSQGSWDGGGEYLSGLPFTAVMKKMAAEKKLIFMVSPTGVVTGTLITNYNRVKAVDPQEGDDQHFVLTGKYNPGENQLLLVLTHLKSRPDNPGSYLTFKKPDSIYYDLFIAQRDNKIITTGIANQTLNKPNLTEWVGSSVMGGLSMTSSNLVNLHLLPLRIRFELPYNLSTDAVKVSAPNTIAVVKPAKKTDTISVSKPVNNPAITPVLETVEAIVRKTEIQRTIILDTSLIKIDLYDNGIIDGDIATLILDGKTIIDQQLLSDKAATITLNLLTTTSEHLLELFADNQGSIPPNTALVVITCNGKRYEINLSSNGTKNGAVKLKFKSN